MSVRVEKFSIERPNLLGCLFCEKPGNLVVDPDEEAYHAIKNVADERQDATRDKFYFLYNDSLSRQCFSWHVKCATSYVCFDGNRRKEKPQLQTVPKTEVKDEPEEDVKVNVEEVEEISVKKEIPYFQRSRGLPSEETVRCLICDKKLNLVHRQANSFTSRLSAAKHIYETAHRKLDSVFKKIRRYHSPEDMIDKGMHYHKDCYIQYLEPKKRPGKISANDMYKGLKKLLDEIDGKLRTNCFELSFLAKRLALLTEVKNAIIEPETVRSLLIANYGDKLLFSYPAGLDSCVVFLSSVPLDEAMKRLQ